MMDGTDNLELHFYFLFFRIFHIDNYFGDLYPGAGREYRTFGGSYDGRRPLPVFPL